MAQRVGRRIAALGAGLLVLGGCTLSSSGTSAGAVRGDLVACLNDAQQSQTAALALWDRVIFGEAVSCQDAIHVPEPVSVAARDLTAHPEAGAIQARLNAAIQTLHDSSDLWNATCADDQPYVPLSTAREGRATALAAGTPLAEARQLLSAWPDSSQ
jgi:hypothetical protein